ncbi:MAG: DUF1049 domain-containing protein [Cyanobacteria bacterium P01_B01_bin.77]
MFHRWTCCGSGYYGIGAGIEAKLPGDDMTKFLLVLISAFLVVAISILSLQNATPISLQFLAFRSVELPFGLWLGFGLAAGMVGMASLLTLSGSRR